MAIEKPAYTVLEHHPDFEVREYGSYIVAETEVEGDQASAGNEAFSRLAGFIFGKNRAGKERTSMIAPVSEVANHRTRIAMTAPVTQVSTGQRNWRVQFMMPSGYTLETLPEPTDGRVSLRALPARRFAAIRYSGTWSSGNYDRHLAQLRTALAEAGMASSGEPVWARYDPPFKPWFLRTNEILLEVG